LRRLVMTLLRRFVNEAHVHEFQVTDNVNGWVVFEREDAITLREVHHNDWHRVERETALFELHVPRLQERGWIETPPVARS
jgi:hypothetical protein